MIAVIFELTPSAEGRNDYFRLAAELRPQLESMDGFISVERFQSVADPGRFLSLSFWRDENAVRQWRNLAEHRNAQTEGRNGVLDDYRLRVAEVRRDYGLHDRMQAPSS